MTWRLLGAAGCLAIGVAYVLVWPHQGDPHGLAYVVLRFFHGLVWVAFAAAILVGASRFRALAGPLALCGGALYALFLVVLVTNR